MAVRCDACNTKLNDKVSKCCHADVWAELRMFSERYICSECGEECAIVDNIIDEEKKIGED